MVGHGSLEHLDFLIHNSTSDCPCCNIYKHDLWNGTGYKERDDVYISYDELSGPLSVGYAAPNQFGPELGLGWALGDVLVGTSGCDGGDMNENKSTTNQAHQSIHKPLIYLIKTAWGGQTLATDFRPPSAGEGHYPDVLPSFYGHRYRDMVNGVREGLERLPKIIPSYNETIGYELSGFVWFQGWNDMLDENMVSEYAANLAHLLRDVMREWAGLSSRPKRHMDDVKKLPIIIGELGMHGSNYHGAGAARVQAMRAAQAAVAASPEFHASFVKTTPYVVLDGATFNGIYHYYGRADTYYHIGKAMGHALWNLWQQRDYYVREAQGRLRGGPSMVSEDQARIER